MFANSARFASKLQPVIGQSSRQMSAISGPPQVRISPAEKALHGLALVVGIMAVPAWVLVHIRSYRGLS